MAVTTRPIKAVDNAATAATAPYTISHNLVREGAGSTPATGSTGVRVLFRPDADVCSWRFCDVGKQIAVSAAMLTFAPSSSQLAVPRCPARNGRRTSFAFKAKLSDFASMAKYDPLHAYLRRQKGDVCELSFREIENLIGYLLPNGSSEPGWWANVADESSSRAVQRTAWLGAGFHAELHRKADRVVFTKAKFPASAALEPTT